MSLVKNLRTLGNRETINVVLWSSEGDRFDTGAWPGSRCKNLNSFLMELDQYATERGCDIVKIEVDEFSISFE